MSTASAPTQVELPDGATISTRVHAPGGHGDRPTIIWGHGLSSSMASEDGLALVDWSVAAPDHRVVRYDARGHGHSESTEQPEAYRWDRLAADQLAVADALDVDRYIAAGASMGCATALLAALAAPDRVTALVLVIPPTAWETRREQVGMYEQMAGLLDADRVGVLVAGVDMSPTPDPFTDDDDVWKERARTTLRTTDRRRLARVFRGAATADLPPPQQLTAIELPTLVLAWSGDPGHPVSTAERLHELLPQSTLHIASTAGDLAGWSDLVARFLDADRGE
ncbi:MAG: alpha/beta hydrolase [Actinomycetota bacterium]